MPREFHKPMNIISILLTIPAVLIALTVHECAHGYAAWRLGDPTARSLGRLSLNPLRHLDPIGTLCMIFFRFGWAKPVPINSRYFKKPRRDMAITALCGPISNFLLALLGAFLYIAFLLLFNTILTATEVSRIPYLIMEYFLTFLYGFHYVNLTLGLFNCIPIPPLDGSRFFLLLLPAKVHYAVLRYERAISIALMLIIFLGVRFGFLSAVADWISGGMLSLVQLIFGIG